MFITSTERKEKFFGNYLLVNINRLYFKSVNSTLNLCLYVNCGVMYAIPHINQSEEIIKQQMCFDWWMCAL